MPIRAARRLRIETASERCPISLDIGLLYSLSTLPWAGHIANLSGLVRSGLTSANPALDIPSGREDSALVKVLAAGVTAALIFPGPE